MNEDFPEYHEALDALHFSPEAKERLVQNVTAAAAAESQATAPVTAVRGGRHRWRVIAAVAAAAALVLAVGGGAYASGVLVSMEQAFSDLFGGAPAQTEVVDKIGRPVGASATADGVTITADAIIGDRSNYAIVFTVTNVDGTPFEGIEPLEGGALPMSIGGGLNSIKGMTGSGGSSYFYDADPADNAIQLVMKMSASMADGETLIGKTARVSFGHLSAYNDKENDIVIAEGPWEMEFVINYEDTTVDVPAGQYFNLGGMDAKLNSVSISPIAITVYYTVNDHLSLQENSGLAANESTRELMRFMPTIVVTMKDGSTIDATYGAWGSDEVEGETICHTSSMFTQFIDVNEVATITVGDVEIPLN
ncbi:MULTISPECIES: DUF4179 domain-containing protein [Gordonibacter]|uniref:DUF4179 domain-containing protein n=1 Tax=Gordonibacter faecis TaxID=3047475 RepID=A0ABT7DMG1_9ACTN|nr:MULTISPECIES: DUF4179 domain-containing protein [unclassified Gordonibacter]MDJ1649370.1 DUF4179 domain-containing protein [Gordonibacter sp. KGMB12511]HIW75163.1 DUF4179 domain-containing protein [Candidatus Gordonibacter avicola]